MLAICSDKKRLQEGDSDAEFWSEFLNEEPEFFNGGGGSGGKKKSINKEKLNAIRAELKAIRMTFDADFKEEQHPRAASGEHGGEFTKKGSSTGSKKTKAKSVKTKPAEHKAGSKIGNGVESAYEIVKNQKRPDLTNMDLRGIDFKNEAFKSRTDRLRGIDISDMDLRGCNLSGVDFKGTNCNTMKFSHCNLTGADFTGVNLYRAEFDGANLTDCKLAGSETAAFADYGSAHYDHIAPVDKAVIDSARFEHEIFSSDPVENKKEVEKKIAKSSGITSGAVRKCIQQWASTSADDSYQSIAAQLMAKEEFKLSDASIEHFDEKTQRVAEKLMEGNTPLKKMIQAQYDQTQKWFAERKYKPDDEIVLYRGLKSGKELGGRVGLPPEKQVLLDQVKALMNIYELPVAKEKYHKLLKENNLTDSEFVELQKKEHALSEPPPANGTVKLQPLSSFSSSYDVATGFGKPKEGGVVFACRVPVKDIFSHPKTGYGCTDEREFVVLGGDKKFVMVKQSHDAAKLFEYDDKKTKDSVNQSVNIDKELINADWTKTTWDLPKFKSPEFYEWLGKSGLTMEHFMTLPVYQNLKDK